MKTNKLTLERLMELLRYDAQTGEFFWLQSRQRSMKNQMAGEKQSNGYIRIKIDQVKYHAHRLAWFAAYGALPAGFVDHINGDRSDNRLANLRDVSPSQNSHNMKFSMARNRTGYLGVYPNHRGAGWCAKISRARKLVHLGTFDTPAEAGRAYLAAKHAAMQHQSTGPALKTA